MKVCLPACVQGRNVAHVLAELHHAQAYTLANRLGFSRARLKRFNCQVRFGVRIFKG